MIAMKREVAAGLKGSAGFPWSECQGPNWTQTDDKSLYQFSLQLAETPALRMRVSIKRETALFFRNHVGHARKSVQSPLVVLNKKKRFQKLPITK